MVLDAVDPSKAIELLSNDSKWWELANQKLLNVMASIPEIYRAYLRNGQFVCENIQPAGTLIDWIKAEMNLDSLKVAAYINERDAL